MPVARGGARPVGLTFRPAVADDLPACAEIWRTAINDYIGRLGQTEIPPEIDRIVRLYRHLQATDPDRFVVACLPDPGGDRVVAFASAVVRERLWFLSMLFVLPEVQGAGLGRELLAHVLPQDGSMVRATATDSAQPISNALYASVDIVPRIPLFSLVGLPQRPEAFGALPSGIVALPFDELAAGPPDAMGHRLLVEAIDALDRDLLGVAHPVDHRFLRSEVPPRLAVPRSGRRTARLRLRRGGRPGRPGGRRRPRPARPGARPPDGGRPASRRLRGLDRPAPRTGRSRRPSRPASGSTSSPSCSAGTGRSPTSRAISRSRRASSDRRVTNEGPVRRGTGRHVCRTTARVVASTSMRLPLPCPRNGVVRS